MYFQHRQKTRFFILWLLLLFLLPGCSTQHVVKSDSTSENISADDPDEAEAEADPLEGFNRAMFGFNETVDTFVAEPITKVYTYVMPNFMLEGVSNFYSNLNGFNNIINDVLQAKFEQGLSDTGRLALNSTLGMAGFIDVATYVGLEQHDEDFEQTLAVWGVPSGPYLVLPFVGPGTLRGIPGYVVDAAGHPVTYLPVGFAVVGALNRRANAQGSLKFIDEAALDPYVFTRESYLQFREHQIKDGKGEVKDQLTDFDEALFEDEFFEEEFDEIEMEQASGTDGIESVITIQQVDDQSGKQQVEETLELQVETDSSDAAEIPGLEVQSAPNEGNAATETETTPVIKETTETEIVEIESLSESGASNDLGEKPPLYELPRSW